MENILIWGTGKVSQKFVDEISKYKEINIIGFIDNNPEKQGMTFFEREVFSPDCLLKISFDKIVICSIYFEEIKKQIASEFSFAIEKTRNIQYFLYQVGIITRYKNNPDKEIQELLTNLEKRDLQVFNYDFTDKYSNMNVEPCYDENHEMYYLRLNDKKMYFARHLDNPEKVKKYYQSICEEQDEKSPHKYFADGFFASEDDTVVDVGVAEGNFTLSIIDKIKKAYLVEADERWVEALKLTFNEYKDKVVFVNKFVSCYSFGPFEILDNLINEPVNIIKMDIEGSECDALEGITNIVKISPKLKVIISAYHNDYDEQIIRKKLEALNFEVSTSSGYMWYPYKKTVTTKLCRGLVRGVKKH